jgi:hypothetical protein
VDIGAPMLPVAVIATFHHDDTFAYWIYLHFQTRARVTWHAADQENWGTRALRVADIG